MARTADTGRNDAGDDDRAERRPGRPRDPGYDKTILDAALEILFDKGYAGLTIDGVAAQHRRGPPHHLSAVVVKTGARHSGPDPVRRPVAHPRYR